MRLFQKVKVQRTPGRRRLYGTGALLGLIRKREPGAAGKTIAWLEAWIADVHEVLAELSEEADRRDADYLELWADELEKNQLEISQLLYKQVRRERAAEEAAALEKVNDAPDEAGSVERQATPAKLDASRESNPETEPPAAGDAGAVETELVETEFVKTVGLPAEETSSLTEFGAVSFEAVSFDAVCSDAVSEVAATGDDGIRAAAGAESEGTRGDLIVPELEVRTDCGNRGNRKWRGWSRIAAVAVLCTVLMLTWFWKRTVARAPTAPAVGAIDQFVEIEPSSDGFQKSPRGANGGRAWEAHHAER